MRRTHAWLILTGGMLAAGLLAGGCGEEIVERPALSRGLIVLGVDGMDPKLLDKYMREGRMPNAKALAERGSYRTLGTSFPPQSPVAWSMFITGMGSHGHGIYDFVHRDPARLDKSEGMYLSTSRAEPAETWKIGSWAVPNPFSSGGVTLLRAGRAFWQDLEDARIPATIVKVPANFPPVDSRMNESMAEMGTPDLLGTPGTFQLLTNDPKLVKRNKEGAIIHPSAGIVHALEFGESGQVARAELTGPPDPMSADGKAMTVPIEVIRDRAQPVALVRLDEDTEILLKQGEWSEWLEVGFDPGITGGAVPGIVRLYLAETQPHFRMYVSPINIDPADPVMPLSAPEHYAPGLAADVGRFYTLEMPEDTKALESGALTDDEFLSQADTIYEERLAILRRELDRYKGGVLFMYIGSIDQISHVFWRAIEPDAKPEDAKYAHVIPDIYARVDEVIGEVMRRAGPDTDIVVMSDHGFAPYRYKVHLNTWLAQQGYLSLLPPDKVRAGDPLGHIDWENTQAYALGLNQLFINLQGRETHGVVRPEDYESLLRQLSRQLESFRDPETGAQVITEAARSDDSNGDGKSDGSAVAFPDRAPDLLIGYSRGYRSSDASALGEVGEELIERNTDKWSGDHCMHPSHVPGVLLTTRVIDDSVKQPTLMDLAPTILMYFGVAQPDSMKGQPLWQIELSQGSNDVR